MHSKRSINWKAFEYYGALKQIHHYCLQRPGEPLSLTEAADLAAMAPAYFSRFFHHKTGVTFKYWIDFMRVNHASNLFLDSNKTIVEVLQECGFQDPTTFTRTFRRISGLTPIAFRRNVRERVAREGLSHSPVAQARRLAARREAAFKRADGIRRKVRQHFQEILNARGDLSKQVELNRKYLKLQQQWQEALQKYREAHRTFAESFSTHYWNEPDDGGRP